MAPRSADIIDVIEAAYDLSGDHEAWLAGIVRACRPHLDRGMGVAAFTFEVSAGQLCIGHVAEIGTPDGFGHAYRAISRQTPPSAIERAYLGAPGLETYRHVFRDAPEAIESMDRQIGPALGLHDFVALNALDPTGHGVAIVAPTRSIEPPPDMGNERWLKVAAHLTAGLRLRGDAAEEVQTPLPLGAEAVLDPQGKVVEAIDEATSGQAQEALRAAMKHADQARGKLRRDDADLALDVWRGLVEGRWSLVDWFDTDGRRFVVARRNDPDAPDPRALTPRERQVAHCVALGHPSKIIAYELGLSPSTVATHLSHAMRKLGVSSKPELVYLMRLLQSGSGPPE